MPPPRAVLSTPRAQRRSSVRARPGMPRTTWACSVLRSSSSTRPAVRRVRRPSRGAIGRGVGARRGRRPSRRRRGPGVRPCRGRRCRRRRRPGGSGRSASCRSGAMRSRGEGVDRVDRAEDRAAERGVAEHGVREQVVHAVARVVLGHGDLFEDRRRARRRRPPRGSASRSACRRRRRWRAAGRCRAPARSSRCTPSP